MYSDRPTVKGTGNELQGSLRSDLPVESGSVALNVFV